MSSFFFKETIVLSLLCLFITPFVSSAQQQKLTLNELLRIVKPESPRIIYTFKVQDSIDSLTEKDPAAKAILKSTIVKAEDILKSPLVDFSSVSDKNAFEFFDRIITLVMASRHSGRKEFFDRVIQEMDSAAEAAWDPKRVLITAVITSTLSLGYDWLYTSLDGGRRKKYNEAIYNKGIKIALIIYQKTLKKGGSKVEHIQSVDSTDIIFHSSMLLSATALAKDYPDAASKTITYAVNALIQNSNALAINEGSALLFILSQRGLLSGFNKDFGLSKSPLYSNAEDIMKNHTTVPPLKLLWSGK